MELPSAICQWGSYPNGGSNCGGDQDGAKGEREQPCDPEPESVIRLTLRSFAIGV